VWAWLALGENGTIKQCFWGSIKISGPEYGNHCDKCLLEKPQAFKVFKNTVVTRVHA
jgi:hypothetical protein